MKILHQEANLLILRELPVLAWIIVIIFFVAGGLYLLAQRDKQGLFLGSAFMASSILAYYGFGPVTTCVYDKIHDTLTIFQQRLLFGTKIHQARLSEIEDVQVEELIDSEGDTYRVSNVLKSGDRLPLTPYYSSGSRSKKKIAAEIKSFLNL